MKDTEFESQLQNVNVAEVLARLESSYPIEIIDDPSSPRVQEVAALDAALFGEHKSLPAEAFQDIIKNGGAVFGHVNESGSLISEASLILTANPEKGECSLERGMPKWLAYCDGAAVSENYRGKGLQRELLTAREMIAQEASKEASSASVRHRNLASIRSMLKNGYMMIGDAPKYYGEGAENDRVVMLKLFGLENPLEELSADNEALNPSHKGLTELNAVDEKISNGADVVALAVEQNDDVDEVYNAALSKLLRSGYVGVACHDLDIGDSDGDRESAMIFVKTSTLGSPAEQLAGRQTELQTVLDQS